MANLRPVAQNVQRILSLEHLLHEVGHDVAHRQLHVAAEDVHVAKRPTLADPDAVEGTNDGVREPVLVVGGPGEILDSELLKPVGGNGGRNLPLLTLVMTAKSQRTRRPWRN